jgi:ribosomal protein S18 acetylase RimI-like enzyme
MEIRRLATSDYERIINLWSRAGLPFKPKGRDSKKAVTAQMEINPGFFLGAFEDGSLVGVAVLSSDTRKGWINRLAVDPDYRQRGIAKALIAESEKILRKHGLGIFCALIEDYNTKSKELFKECGYEERRDIVYFSKRDSDKV